MGFDDSTAHKTAATRNDKIVGTAEVGIADVLVAPAEETGVEAEEEEEERTEVAEVAPQEETADVSNRGPSSPPGRRRHIRTQSESHAVAKLVPTVRRRKRPRRATWAPR